MTTMNASNELNGLNVVDLGSGELKESFWSRFLEQLIRGLSGTCGYSDEELENMDQDDLVYLQNYWLMW